MATHHETVGGTGEPLQIPINQVFTFQGRPDKWGFTVVVPWPLFFQKWIIYSILKKLMHIFKILIVKELNQLSEDFNFD